VCWSISQKVYERISRGPPTKLGCVKAICERSSQVSRYIWITAGASCWDLGSCCTESHDVGGEVEDFVLDPRGAHSNIVKADHCGFERQLRMSRREGATEARKRGEAISIAGSRSAGSTDVDQEEHLDD
jgi:hypothetical protein